MLLPRERVLQVLWVPEFHGFSFPRSKGSRF
jgi:hypothetical protein